MHREMGSYAAHVFQARHALFPGETWYECATRTSFAVFAAAPHASEALAAKVRDRIAARQYIPAGRYLANAGRDYHQVQNCLLLRVLDSRESLGEHFRRHMLALTTGAGLGTVYSALRPAGSSVGRTGGTASGPLSYAIATNDLARPLRGGKERKSALWAGLHWWHKDIDQWIVSKDWPEWLQQRKNADWNTPAPLDGTNISVCYDQAWLQAMEDGDLRAYSVYRKNLHQALRTGDPGFSCDFGENDGEDLRNACTEAVSRDSNDVCNLGSLNLAAFDHIDDFAAAVEESILHLLAGSLYSDLPYEEIQAVRTKNRRLGLGLMGVQEWLLKRGKRFGPDAELGRWLRYYAQSTEIARRAAEYWGITQPVATRAVAPNGTIGILAETGTSEPMLCVAKKRRIAEGDKWRVQYIVDPVAERAFQLGIPEADIESAYSLSMSLDGVRRRLEFQAWLQQFVDQGISSTINLAPWGSPTNNAETAGAMEDLVLQYLPRLRGLTFYPDGARGGQPMVEVPLSEARAAAGQVFYESGDVCDLRGGGTCG